MSELELELKLLSVLTSAGWDQHLTPSKPEHLELSSGRNRWERGRKQGGGGRRGRAGKNNVEEVDGQEVEEERGGRTGTGGRGGWERKRERKRRSSDGGQEPSGVMNLSLRLWTTRTGVSRAGCLRHLFGTAA